MVWVPAQIKIALPERSVFRGWKSSWERIGGRLTRALLGCLGCCLRAKRIGKCAGARSHGASLQKELRTERRRVYEPVIVHAAYPSVVEDAAAAAQTCLAIAKNVPGEAQPGRKVIHAVAKPVVWEASVAGKEEPRWSIGKYRRMCSGDQVG